MKRIISMSTKELTKIEVIGNVAQKRLKQQQAADILEITIRQVRRLLKKYQIGGAEALISQKRGRPSNNQLSPGLTETVLSLIREKYFDFGPTLAHEKITEVHNLEISLRSVRKIMIENDVWIDKKIKKRRVYQLRKRRSKKGELVQMDGSPHDWFEGRGPYCTFIHCVDDATGEILAGLFVPSEAIWTYFSLMRLYFKKHGKPAAFYVDKHSVFRVNAQDALSGDGITQFGRAMQELGIKLIFANSPQAKGRIERSNQTLQDRLVKELRLHDISTIKAANDFLPAFLDDLNRRFSVVPENPNNAHTPLLKEQDLDVIFTIQSSRVLSKNLTFQYNNTVFQIQSDRQAYALRKAQVFVREKEDKSIVVLYKGKSIAYSTYASQQKQCEVVDSKRLNECMDNYLQQSSKSKYKPSNRHPWKCSPRGPMTTPF